MLLNRISILLVQKNICFLLSISLLYILLSTTAKAEITLKPQYRLSLDSQSIKDVPLKNPLYNNSYFYHDTMSSLYFNSDENQQKKLLDIKTHYPDMLVFNTIALHPNFALNQQTGFLTFYTAHTEPANPEKKVQRIKRDNQASMLYEAVIIEWSFNTNDTQGLSISNSKPREVLRLAIPNKDSGFQQLIFNPNIKPWSEEYGQLFFTLATNHPNNTPENTADKFSGAIFTIHPHKFGLKSYTVPATNPYIKNNNIADEIIAFNVPHLTKINWFKSDKDTLIISQKSEKKHIIRKISIGDNTSSALKNQRNIMSDESLLTSNNIIYRGAKYRQYRNHLMYLRKADVWALITVENQSPFHQEEVAKFNISALNPSNNVTLVTDSNDEILLFDHDNQVLYTIEGALYTTEKVPFPQPENLTPNAKALSKSHTADISSSSIIIVITSCFVLFILWMRFFYRGSLQPVKAILKKNFATFSIDETSQTIKLYKRHETTEHITLNINDIKHSHLFLNDKIIFLLDKNRIESIFSNAQEKHLLLLFTKETREKMVDDKTRKIVLTLTSKDNVSYSICIYLRTGNQRLTKPTFNESQKQILDWFWLLSNTVFSEETEERTIIEQTHLPIKTPALKQSIPKDGMNETISHEIDETKPKPDEQKHVDSITPDEELLLTESNSTLNDGSEAHLDIIHALEKLGKLKQQNLLTEQEFETMKQSLLNNIPQEEQPT